MNWFKKVLAKSKLRKLDMPELFENFTPDAKKVLAFANEEALRLRHNYIGTEHVLLGLVKFGEGVAGHTLVKLWGFNLEIARQEVEKIVGLGPDRKSRFPSPYTPRAKAVFVLARNEAKLLNHTFIGPEELLLGLLLEGSGIAARALKNFDLDIILLRKEILHILNIQSPSSDDPQVV